VTPEAIRNPSSLGKTLTGKPNRGGAKVGRKKELRFPISKPHHQFKISFKEKKTVVQTKKRKGLGEKDCGALSEKWTDIVPK